MSKKILFLPYKLHFRPFLFELAERVPLTVMLPPEKSLPEVTKLKGVRIEYSDFGMSFLKPLFKGKRTLKYVKGLSKLLKQQDFDVLMTCEFYHWYTLQCIAYKKKNPNFKLFVINETKRWPKNFVAYAFKRILFAYFKKNLRYIDKIYTYTDEALRFIKENIPEAKVELLPTPTNLSLFKPEPNKNFLPDGELRLFMNARYSKYKRHKDIFAALASLREDGKKVRLTCISRDQKGREETVALANKMGVADIVNFMDPRPVEEIPELYYQHDVLVLPSYNEAIGIVIPEVMACSMPTITSDTVGGNVYVKDGETGFIFETGNVDELIDRINRCFDVELLEKMGEKARKRILENFTAETIVDNFLASIND